ncbi:MAG TPA: ATP-dependent Clp protease adaptor ClpS [Polyangiales bacterium]
MADRDQSGTGVITRTHSETERKLKKPPRYKVLMHNDDYTTREFVVEVLRAIFHKPEPEAVQVMLHVHQNGVGVAGVYTYEVAEMKVRQVDALSQEREFPLMLTIEPHDGD